jgi:hypothetical protein
LDSIDCDPCDEASEVLIAVSVVPVEPGGDAAIQSLYVSKLMESDQSALRTAAAWALSGTADSELDSIPNELKKRKAT